ncbi:MAG TPA: redoxin domain-containing protein [Phycisphaerae bacterium]|nr:redoxin domain-containing protein [Phycisphaerae bacterium]
MIGKTAAIAAALAVVCGAAGTSIGQQTTDTKKPASEIGPSVQFGPGAGSRLSLTDMKGKVAVVLFFQSWCGICNGWSPELFRQLDQAAADKPEVVLLAVKTDGGGYNGAAKYLKTRISDPARWLIASDQKATWYKVAMGTDTLYSFMVIGPDGTVIDSGKAGMFYSGGDQKKFVLPSKLGRYVQQASPTTILPKDKTYHETLKQAARAAELRQFAAALQLCNRASGKEAKASAAELKKDLTDWAGKQVEALGAVLKDAEADGTKRFEAYLELDRIARGLPRSEPGRQARKAVNEAARDKAIGKQTQAQRAYMTLMSKASQPRRLLGNAEFVAALKALAEKFPDTKFGKMAAADAARVAAARQPS